MLRNILPYKTNLEKKLKYKFKNRNLFHQALRHKSYAIQIKSIEDNEKLEYLGDAVLNLVIGDLLIQKNNSADEGQLSKMRSSLVSTQGLCMQAKKLGIGRSLQLSVSEKANRGFEKPRLLASSFEAVIGAIYMDGGFLKVKKVIERIFKESLSQTTWVDKDYKTLLQGYSQKTYQTTPQYDLIWERGPSHKKLFFSKVLLNNKISGYGKGPTKKESEQKAAQQALKELDQLEQNDN